MLNQDVLEGKWAEWRGMVKERWGKLTDDDMNRINGKRDQLMGKLQQRYGYAKEQAEREIDQFIASHNLKRN
jgi:uncharacterized protein YjbJ (UPF0337 family)